MPAEFCDCVVFLACGGRHVASKPSEYLSISPACCRYRPGGNDGSRETVCCLYGGLQQPDRDPRRRGVPGSEPGGLGTELVVAGNGGGHEQTGRRNCLYQYGQGGRCAGYYLVGRRRTADWPSSVDCAISAPSLSRRTADLCRRRAPADGKSIRRGGSRRAFWPMAAPTLCSSPWTRKDWGLRYGSSH